MSRGRCPGCGAEDASSKKIRSHMNECAEVARLHQEDPGRLIDPEAEASRWSEWMGSPEGQEALQSARDERDEGYKVLFEAKLTRERARWKPSTPVV